MQRQRQCIASASANAHGMKALRSGADLPNIFLKIVARNSQAYSLSCRHKLLLVDTCEGNSRS